MRSILVTGGGTGIGRAIAEKFASGGDRVFIVGRRKDVLDKVVGDHPGLEINPVSADLTKLEDVRRVVEVLGQAPVDVLVNNAGGIIKDQKPGLEGALDAYQRTIESNLISAMILTEALWQNLKRPGGRVINISSIAAHRGGGDAYAAAKAGLYGWGFGLAKQGGPDGITVNAVAPGYVQDTEFFNERGRSARHDKLVAETLLGRAGVPDDIAAVVHFLASAGASWITGQVIGVNGGSLLGH